MALSLGNLFTNIKTTNPRLKLKPLESNFKPAPQATPTFISEPFIVNTKGLGNIYGKPSIREGANLNIPKRELNNSSYLTKLLYEESKNDYNAYNKSGATGGYQFYESTAEPYLKKINATWDQFKADPGIQDYVAEQHTAYNAKRLKKFNLPVTNFNLWALHNQGGTGGIRIIRNSKNVNLKNIKANLPKGIEPTVANYKAYWEPKFS